MNHPRPARTPRRLARAAVLGLILGLIAPLVATSPASAKPPIEPEVVVQWTGARIVLECTLGGGTVQRSFSDPTTRRCVDDAGNVIFVCYEHERSGQYPWNLYGGLWYCTARPGPSDGITSVGAAPEQDAAVGPGVTTNVGGAAEHPAVAERPAVAKPGVITGFSLRR